MQKFFNPKVRTFLYGLFALYGPVALIVFGITEQQWTLISGTTTGTFALILALSNTPVTSADSLKKELNTDV